MDLIRVREENKKGKLDHLELCIEILVGNSDQECQRRRRVTEDRENVENSNA